MSSFNDSTLSSKTLLLAVLLIIAAAVPRLYNLGEQGFYMDEETTAFASRAILNGNEAQMPSGMPYRRALPHSWLNSVSARILGADKELSYRLPGAIFGILTVPLIFFLARPYVGTSVAFLAALLLAFSEWHIITSRQARMYAPFLFFYIACAFSILAWAKRDEFKFLVIATSLFVMTVSFQSLGVFAAFFPLVALFIKGYSQTPYYKLIAFSFIGGIAAYIYGQLFVGEPYQSWKAAHGIILNTSDSGNAVTQLLTTNGLLTLPAAIGVFLGIWLAKNSKFPDSDNGWEFRAITRYLVTIIFACLSASGHLHGAFLSMLLMMLLYPGSLLTYIKQTYKPLIAIATVATITTTITLSDLGLTSGLKASLSFPYPYWITLHEISPGITLLFVSALTLLALKTKTTEEQAAIAMGVYGLFPLIIVGIAMKWAPSRYLLVAYPFILISSTLMLYYIITRATDYFSITSGKITVSTSYLIGLSGILGGHGVLQAYSSGTVTHGDSFNETSAAFPFYPDHKHPGEFVAKHKKPDDLVIAEDVLVQKWYAGNIDYWLRDYDADSDFMYKGRDQNIYDIYVNSTVATTDILDYLTNSKPRMWLITSGETHNYRDYYLNNIQHAWLNNIEQNNNPVFIGEDNITKVYCLNCDNTI